MPRLFVGNFDFEHDLANRTHAAVSQSNDRRRAHPISVDLASAWIAIAESDDIVFATAKVNSSDFGELRDLGLSLPRFVTDLGEVKSGSAIELVPWGWTPHLAALARSSKWSSSAPDFDVVRTVNSRAFRLQLELEWQIGLAGARAVRTIEELESSVAEFGAAPRGWVLKAAFGMSGRERILGRGSQLTLPIINWAKRRLNQSGTLVFEPWVERIAEAGIQVSIPKSGSPELVGVTPLLCDHSGIYRGNRCGCPAAELPRWQSAMTIALRTASRLQERGYFGPLGIDAMWYRDTEGVQRLRPLQDINARYTMGRLSLGFRRLLAPEQQATWLHFPSSSVDETRTRLTQFRRRLPPDMRWVATSPSGESEGEILHASALLIAPATDSLEPLESRFLTEVLGKHKDEP